MIRNIRNRARRIIALLKKEYPNSRCSLNYETAHQLLVATVLSAQSTDEAVNKVTPGLFRKYRSVEAYAAADLNDLENDIRSIGLYRNKAKAIRRSAEMILHDFGGSVPNRLEEITRLPGVGRKSGSAVIGEWYGRAEGIVVDTHVMRLANLLGLTKQKDPVKIEDDLMKIIPKKDWIIFTHLMIDHGRAVCIARRPRCEICTLSRQCPSSAT